MSQAAFDWAKRQKTPTSGVKCLLLILAIEADSEGRCYPSRATLARECCCTKHTVKNNLKVLVAMGLVDRTARRMAGGKQISDAYQLHLNS